jgi:hypothetical protein
MRCVLWTFVLLSPLIALAQGYHRTPDLSEHVVHLALNAAARATHSVRSVFSVSSVLG